MRPVRLAYLTTHPTQHQAPLLKRIAAEPDIDLVAYFASDISTKPFVHPDFGRAISWDVPLLDGYRHEFLPMHGRKLREGELPDFWRPVTHGLRDRLRQHRPDVLLVHRFGRLHHLAALRTADHMGIKVLLRDETNVVAGRVLSRKEKFKRLLFPLLDRHVDAYLATGSLNAQSYRGLGVGAHRIFDMPIAVDNRLIRRRVAAAEAEREKLRTTYDIRPGQIVILYAGRLIERKRPMDLLAAFAALQGDPTAPGTALLYAGDGPLQGMLRATIEELGLVNARVLGLLPPAQLIALLGLADIVAVPSARESWGVLINEAMNAGCAIVAADGVGAAADLVRNGENGFVHPAGNVGALTQNLRRLVTEPGRLRSMQEASRRLIDRWDFDRDLAGLRQALAAILPSLHPR